MIPRDRKNHELFPSALGHTDELELALEAIAGTRVVQVADLLPTAIVGRNLPMVIEGVVRTVKVRPKIRDCAAGRLVYVELHVLDCSGLETLQYSNEADG